MPKTLWLLRGPSATGKTEWAEKHQYETQHCRVLSPYSSGSIRSALLFEDEVIIDMNCGEGIEALARQTFEPQGIVVQVKDFTPEWDKQGE